MGTNKARQALTTVAFVLVGGCAAAPVVTTTAHCPGGRCTALPLRPIIREGTCVVPPQADYYVPGGYDAFWTLPTTGEYAFAANGIDILRDTRGDFVNGRLGTGPNVFIWTANRTSSGLRLSYEIHFTYKPNGTDITYPCDLDPVIVNTG